MKAVGFLVVLSLGAWPAAVPAYAQQFAADLPVGAPAAEPSFQGYGDHDRTCVAWTDECRACAREDGKTNCSNIGIACQPAAIRCTARQQPPK